MDRITDVVLEVLGNGGQDDQFGDVESPFGYNALIRGKRYLFIYHEDTYGTKDVTVVDREDHDEWERLWEMHKDEHDEWDTRMSLMSEIYALQ